MAFRGIELLLAFALLAVLIELVLVLVNAPDPVPEIRFIRVQTPPQEAALPNGLKPVEMPVTAAPELAAAPLKPVAAPRPVVRKPEPPAPPALLDFANLRRLLGGRGGGSSAGGSAGGQGSVANDPAPPPTVVMGPGVIPAPDAPPTSGNPPVPGTPPPAQAPTNGENPVVSNTSTNNTHLESTNTFRISVP